MAWLSVAVMTPAVTGLDASEAKEKPYIASMGIYVFRKELMCRLLREKSDSNDFGGEIIPAAAKDNKVGCHALCA